MTKWRKKPVVIDAWRVSELLVNAANCWKALPEEIIDAYEAGGIVFASEAIHINTLEGTMIGDWSDWVIRGVAGELYPCKDDIFRATYNLVAGENE